MELITFNLDPILDGFLDAQLPVWNVGIPSIVSRLRPFERVPVVRWCWDHALEKLTLLRAMPFPVHELLPFKFLGSLWIMTGSVLTEAGIASWVIMMRHVEAQLMVRFEVELTGRKRR